MNAFDEIWEQIHNEQEWGKYPSEEVIRFVARNYYKGDRASTRILDAGCGAGAVSWYLSREGFQVFAFDGSKTAVEKAIKRINDETLYVRFDVADAASMPYEDNFFSAVIDSAMIYANTTAGIRVILGECHRVLKPGGKLFSTGLFQIGMSGYGTGEKIEEHTYRELTEGNLAHRGTVHFFDEAQIMKYWSEAGFDNIKVDLLERTDFGGKSKVSYYMAEAQKV